MKLSRRFLVAGIPLLVFLASLSASGQWDKKPPAEWTQKDAIKVLNDSPWGRTQTFDSPMEQYRGPVTGRQGVQSSTNTNLPKSALHLNFRVRFLSSRPIRQALTRLMELKVKGGINDEVADQLKKFASGEFLEIIVLAVVAESDDTGANVQQANALLSQGSIAKFKNNTFLEIKGGKRLFIQEYQPPRPDGFGARFIFQRIVDEKPFITPESEEIHFVAPLSDVYRLDRRFKTKEMMYEGKLEY
jgi:hypothetical protein